MYQAIMALLYRTKNAPPSVPSSAFAPSSIHPSIGSGLRASSWRTRVEAPPSFTMEVSGVCSSKARLAIQPAASGSSL